MFGFIKNYSWKARMDGGYDCTTEIISIGEVIESLKVNYSPLDSNIGEGGLISSNVSIPSIPTSDVVDVIKNVAAVAVFGLGGLAYDYFSSDVFHLVVSTWPPQNEPIVCHCL
jgi:hypothetical protein